MGSLPDLAHIGDDHFHSHCTSRRAVREKCMFQIPFVMTSSTVAHKRALRHTRSLGNCHPFNVQSDKCCHVLKIEQDSTPANLSAFSSGCAIHHCSSLLNPHQYSIQRGSMSSSAGALSVRRLIAVVRSTPSANGPAYSRRLLLKNFTALCLGHSMITAAFVPLFALESSMTVWKPDYAASYFGIGSLLLASLFAVGSLSTFLTVYIVNKLGSNWTLISSYSCSCIFIAAHLYPKLYTLIPAYILLGFWLGPLTLARMSSLMTLSTKLTYVMSQKEEAEVDYRLGIQKVEVVIYKFARGMQIAQDVGLIVGNIATSFLMWYTVGNTRPPNRFDYNLDHMFPQENGDRVCGSDICPRPYSVPQNISNDQESVDCKTGTLLASVFLGFCVMAVAVTAAFMDNIKSSIHKEVSFRRACSTSLRLTVDVFKDRKMQLAAPLALFIGLEQGFMLNDFTQSYVACALGIGSISLVFLSLGVLQAIAAFTLSLVLQHIRRHMIIVVGFIFQACLLLVLFLWKPTKEDPALFYVIPAAWGVCNAIWDTLNFTLIASIYPESWHAPFTHSYFFRHLGLAFAFGINSWVCNVSKLYGLAASMVFAVTPYAWLEYREEAERKCRTRLSTL